MVSIFNLDGMEHHVRTCIPKVELVPAGKPFYCLSSEDLRNTHCCYTDFCNKIDLRVPSGECGPCGVASRGREHTSFFLSPLLPSPWLSNGSGWCLDAPWENGGGWVSSLVRLGGEKSSSPISRGAPRHLGVEGSGSTARAGVCCRDRTNGMKRLELHRVPTPPGALPFVRSFWGKTEQSLEEIGPGQQFCVP